jgi:hypothetical protein
VVITFHASRFSGKSGLPSGCAKERRVEVDNRQMRLRAQLPSAGPRRVEIAKRREEVRVDVLDVRNIRRRHQEAHAGVLDEILGLTPIARQRFGEPKKIGVPLQEDLEQRRRPWSSLKESH